MRLPRPGDLFFVGNRRDIRFGSLMMSLRSWVYQALLAFHPDFSVFEKFLFPDWNDPFEFVYPLLPGIERGSAMCGCNDPGHAGFSNLHVAQPMDDGERSNIPGLPDKNSYLFQFFQRHRLVGFVHEMQRTFAF